MSARFLESLTAQDAKTLSYVIPTCLSIGLAFCLGVHFGARNVQPRKEPGHEEEDGGDEEIVDGDLSSIKPRTLEQCKLVLVVRTDLKMTQGKIAAQCGYVMRLGREIDIFEPLSYSHATLACYKALMKTNPKLLQHWERTGQAKIALRGSSEEELLELEAIAKSLNLCARSVLDAGRTQVAAGSRTVLGIGPAPVEFINKVTGHLKLL